MTDKDIERIMNRVLDYTFYLNASLLILARNLDNRKEADLILCELVDYIETSLNEMKNLKLNLQMLDNRLDENQLGFMFDDRDDDDEITEVDALNPEEFIAVD